MLKNLNILIQSIRNKLASINGNWFAIPILFLVSLLRFRNLGHKTIKYWDELFHAIVARNMTKHPLMPTLYEQPYLPYDYTNWTANHIWLHKPPIPLWQIAMSYYMFGVNSFALRLPSALFSGLSVFITFATGSELYDKKVGFVAAFLFAINPLIMGLVHGYIFSDHINIAIVFWVQLSCYLLIKGIKTGKTKYYILCGIAQGLGYLSKSYLCMVAFVIMAGIFILTKIGLLKAYRENISIRKIAFQLLSSIIISLPWVIFCLIKYPKEFIQENNMVLAHLYTEVEIWRKPWDCHLFDYMPGHYPYWYLIVMVSFIFMIIYAIKYRNFRDMFVVIWIMGVITPLSISVSKVPAGMDIATSALLICFAAVAFRMIRENQGISLISYSALILSLFFLSQWPFRLLNKLRQPIIDFVSNNSMLITFTPSLKINPWIIYQLICYFIVFFFLFILYLVLRSLWRKRYLYFLRIIIPVMLIILVYPLSRECIRITHEKPPSYNNYNSDSYDMTWFEDMGNFIKRNLPENSVFILESPTEYDRHYLMFFADRSVYFLQPEEFENSANIIIDKGGIPYIVSTKVYELPLTYKSPFIPNYIIYLYKLDKILK